MIEKIPDLEFKSNQILVILGKIITIFDKRKETKNIAPDIGIIIGLLMVLIIEFIK